MSADRILRLSERDFRKKFALSPVQRAGRAGLLRNAAVVLGNTGDVQWVPLLTHTLASDPAPLVRGHAAWALGQLGGSAAMEALAEASSREQDAYVVEEIQLARNDSPRAEVTA